MKCLDYNYFLDNEIDVVGEEIDVDLGVDYSPEKSKFAVWSPHADKIDLLVYETENEGAIGQIESMEMDDYGIWHTEVKGDLKNKAYNYMIEIDNDIKCAVDPYAKAVTQNGNRGVILDLKDTDPKGWSEDERPHLEKPEDSIIYELHVRDFSISPSSGMKHKGKYLAFTEEGSRLSGTDIKTGIDHLKELGITHLHLQPVFDFATVDESVNYEYNWGYDPKNYNVPEGSYATDSAEPSCRIKEFKKMVQALHENGIRVVMDVVFNHTYEIDGHSFGKLAPGCYYRQDKDGNYSNGSGCGNEVASERPIVRKFIVDSVIHWAKEYHIDGFRFDLMALHDRRTMEKVAEKLHEIDSSIVIYGEPWTADSSPLPTEWQMLKGEQKESGIGVFNDEFRDAIKGSTRGRDRGYATGKLNEGNISAIKEGIQGSINSFAFDPEEVINYVSAHDDLTLWDKIVHSNPEVSEKERIKMNNLSNAIVLTSQGVPFLHAGVEMLRTKYGDANSYKSPDGINQIEWGRKIENIDTFRYYQGLIKLRKNHPAFRMNTAEEISKSIEFISTDDAVIAFQLGEYANDDQWEKIVVIHNPYHETKRVKLPERAKWKVVVMDGKAGTKVLKEITGNTVGVAKISTMVLYK